MALTFETIGNATILFSADGKPVLATDPWLVGTCYYGSWSLDHALTPKQIGDIKNSEFLWISHGHPDHLHHESLQLIPKGKKILVPDHYDRDIANHLADQGFSVEILKYRTWRRLHPRLEVVCLDNENQDAILIARFGDALVINLNDSPYFGEVRYIRRLVRNHPNRRVFVLQLCSIDADMKNFVDAEGKRTIDPPETLKPGAIWAVARGAEQLGAKYFCCSSSQHVYVRSDSVWANAYRIGFDDLERFWSRPEVRLVPPFVTMNVDTETYVENHPGRQTDFFQITDATGDDDWNERLTEEEWDSVNAFFLRLQMLGQFIDFIEVSVGGESRRIAVHPRRVRRMHVDGVTFVVPRRSLIDAVAHGYFDDLLIGNFMKTRLHGRAMLYPFVTPIIAKLGGNAKVYDRRQYAKFCWRYLKRNPAVFVRWRVERAVRFWLEPRVRRWVERLGVFAMAKRAYREWYLRDPVGEARAPVRVEESGVPMSPRPVAPMFRRRGKQTPLRPDFAGYDRPRLIVSIDAEEDFDWREPLSSASKAVHSMTQQYLAQRIFVRHGVKPIYLCDFPIADQPAAYEILREWRATGQCDIGTQLHPWVNPPYSEAVNEFNSYPCNLPLDLQKEKLRRLTDRIVETIGVRSVVYRAGRHGADGQVASLIKPFGYRVDMSLNPIRDYRAYGGPDHTIYPHTPFWLDAEREVLEIPLTGNVMGWLRNHWVSLAEIVWGETAERYKLASILRRLKMIDRVALTPEGIPLDEAKELTRFLMAANHRVFTVTYHSTSLTPGSTPYVRSEADLRAFLGWLDGYLDFFIGELRGIPVMPMDIYDDARSAPVTIVQAA